MITVFNAFYFKMRIRTHQVFVFVLVFTVTILCVDGLGLFSFGVKKAEVPITALHKAMQGSMEETRKKKNKYALNMMLGIFMAKSIILPLVFKAMAVMSGISVLMSTFSLIIASLSGYNKLAWKHAGPTIKIIKNSNAWTKDNDIEKGYIGGYEEFNEQEYESGYQPLKHYHYYKK